MNIKNSKAALLLFWIELFRRHNDYGHGIKELKYNYSLEHIMPIKWQEHWSNIEITYEDSSLVADPIKATEIRDSLISSIGNMTLLTAKLNTVVSNSCFDIKVNGSGRKKGIKPYSDLSITKEVVYSPDGSERLVWSDDSIRERNVVLFNEIISIW